MPRDSSTCRRLLEYMTGQIEDEDNKDDSNTHMSLQRFSAVKLKTEMVTASHFAKINAVFFFKKPAESGVQMLAFIQSQPSIVERLLRHVDMQFIVGLLVRTIQLDEVPGDAGILELLLRRISVTRTVVLEPINGILSMAAASPAPELKMSAVASLQISFPWSWHGPKVRTFTYAIVTSEVPQFRFEVSKINPLY
ncbi:hypothetical protein DFJ58DRAFT_720562 [Suillus subalutaceus]|uniref:uncharacterized protein n=1 Tax=Suillus subalutaceus TaxID=48586 RepID=UPI001B87207F|nr:uncharacterized protein DFJ58DRAFT_720562 [Suillus subalutaceus]KAG1877789.1 hypothetical protein DFJ58DRAFT_720562 [Suillus subalutaceus]